MFLFGKFLTKKIILVFLSYNFCNPFKAALLVSIPSRFSIGRITSVSFFWVGAGLVWLLAFAIASEKVRNKIFSPLDKTKNSVAQ